MYGIVYFFPLLVLYTFWIKFLKYQNSLYSFIHLAYIVTDGLIIFLFLKEKLKNFIKFGVLGILLLSQMFSLIVQILIMNEVKIAKFLIEEFNVKPYKVYAFLKEFYPHLELRGRNLTPFNYEQLKILKSIYKNKPLALLQPRFYLENRSFKYADFSGSIMVRFYFSNVDFSGATFNNVNLQGSIIEKSSFYNTKIINSNFSNTGLYNNVFFKSYMFNNLFKDANLLSNCFIDSRFDGEFINSQLNLNVFKLSEIWGIFNESSIYSFLIENSTIGWVKIYYTNVEFLYIERSNLRDLEFQSSSGLGLFLESSNVKSIQLSNITLDDTFISNSVISSATIKNSDFVDLNILKSKIKEISITNSSLYESSILDSKIQCMKLENGKMENINILNSTSQNICAINCKMCCLNHIGSTFFKGCFLKNNLYEIKVIASFFKSILLDDTELSKIFVAGIKVCDFNKNVTDYSFSKKFAILNMNKNITLSLNELRCKEKVFSILPNCENVYLRFYFWIAYNSKQNLDIKVNTFSQKDIKFWLTTYNKIKKKITRKFKSIKSTLQKLEKHLCPQNRRSF